MARRTAEKTLSGDDSYASPTLPTPRPSSGLTAPRARSIMHQMPALLLRAIVRRGRDRSLVPVAVLGTVIILLMASVPANAWHDHLRLPCLKTRRVYTFTFCVSMLAAAIFGVRALRTFGAAGTPRDSVFRREARGGLSITAHFVVGCAADALGTVDGR